MSPRPLPFARPVTLSLLAATTACGGTDPIPNPDAGQPIFGSLEVRWRLLDVNSAERTCADFGVTAVRVAVGGVPQEVPCAQGSVLFEALLPDRYPVAVEVKADATVRSSKVVNALVTAGARTTADVDFNLDTQGATGDARIRWRVDELPPLTQCAAVGGMDVVISTREGSASVLSQTVPCGAGEYTFTGIRAGTYEVAMKLNDRDGELVASTFVQPFVVEPDQLAEPTPANFVTKLGPPTRIVGLWTVNATTATVGCAAVAGEQVVLSLLARPPQIGTSTSVDCGLGRAVLGDSLGEGLQSVRFQLSYLGASVTSTTVTNVRIVRGRTATVSVDLRAE